MGISPYQGRYLYMITQIEQTQTFNVWNEIRTRDPILCLRPRGLCDWPKIDSKKVKLSLCLIKHYAMKAYGGVDVWIHIFLNSAPGTHWIGDWVDTRTGLDDVEKRKFLTLPGLELRPLGRPAHS
jgi:hypothetical protein